MGIEEQLLAALGVGFALGLKHATDADHVAAVTTFVSRERHWVRSCLIGTFWGLGHTLSLLVAGLIVILLRVNISEQLESRLELVVAGMLIVLGSRALIQAWKRKVELHRLGVRPFLVGIVHGAAGSAGLMLLVLSTMQSPVQAVFYIIVFGAGSIVGMLIVSLMLAVPAYWAQRHMNAGQRSIQLLAGAFSCLFGLYLGVEILLR